MIKTVFFTGLLLFFIGCVSQPGLSTSPRTTPAIIAKSVVPEEAWEVKWEKALAEAKKEGRVMLFLGSGGGARHNEINESFQKKYNIITEVITGPSSLLEGKLLAERRAGLYTTDLFFAGGTNQLGLKRNGALEPIEEALLLPEVVDPKLWWRGNLDFIDKDRYILAFTASTTVPMAVNTDLVKPVDEPKTWKDLLDPRWKDKILLRDPRRPGSPNTLFTVISYYNPELGLDFLRQLARQKPEIVFDIRVQTEWLAKGKYPIGIGVDVTVLDTFRNAGALLKYIMPDGPVALSSGSGNVSFVNRAPHPNAAKIYLNHLLTKEGQTFYTLASGYQSGRVDVPAAHLDPLKRRQPGVKYIETYHEDFEAQRIEATRAAIEIFGAN